MEHLILYLKIIIFYRVMYLLLQLADIHSTNSFWFRSLFFLITDKFLMGKYLFTILPEQVDLALFSYKTTF